uniref:Uncharacterized protein n=1 Tax=Anguilla anguilla TaxID=7936 RepID=A0A0E9VZL2_ANGAN
MESVTDDLDPRREEMEVCYGLTIICIWQGFQALF